MNYLIENIKDIISDTDKLGLIIRHSERDHIPAGKHDIETLLNKKGIDLAIEFGEKIKKFNKIKIISSPVERCKSTAEYIYKGFGRGDEILISHILGEPGPFVYDQFVAVNHFINDTVYGVVRTLQNGITPAGMNSIEKGSRMMLDFILNQFNEVEKGTVLIFITHDAIIAPFIHYFFNEWFDESHWIEFLDGLCLNQYREKIVLKRKDRIHEVC